MAQGDLEILVALREQVAAVGERLPVVSMMLNPFQQHYQLLLVREAMLAQVGMKVLVVPPLVPQGGILQ